MNAMIRALKGILAVLALAAVGVLLRWMTAGSISGLRTYDLDSLTVAAVGTIAWIAYAWLTLAVLLTALEQIPGVIGNLAGAVAGRITTKTARALLRSGLGVAAITPLTVSAAHATPTTAQIRQAPESPSTLQLGNTTAPHKPAADHNTFRATEPPSTVLTSSHPAPQQPAAGRYRATEPASTVQLGGPDSDARRANTEAAEPRQSTDNRQAAKPHATAQTASNHAAPQTPATARSEFRATEPASTVQLGGPDTEHRPTNAENVAHQQRIDSRRTAKPHAITSSETGANQAAPQTPATDRSDFRATEPASTVQIGGPVRRTTAEQAAAQQRTDDDSQAAKPDVTARTDRRATAPHERAADRSNYRAIEPASTVKLGSTAPGPQKSGETAGSDRPAAERPQADVPNQPPGERPRANTLTQPAGERASTDVPEQPTREPGRGVVPQQPVGERARGDRPERPAGGRVGVPDRPTDGAPTRYTELRPTVPVRVVVREGDSLWSIAARELGPTATNEAVAARWPDWYAVNRQVIGDDPDLIAPGQVLRIPPAPNGDHRPPLHQEP